MDWVLIGILIVVALLVLMAILIYNRLVGLRQNCRQGSADIAAQLRQRHDLIPNLVATVKGYATHEQGTFDAVIEARNRAEAPGATPRDEAALSGAVGNLLALAEAYPDLKASANFQQLQGELADTEDKLAAARRAFNSASADYNSARESFPAVLFASAFGFQPCEYHEIAASERGTVDAVPKVGF
jgi:LemA protein